MIRDFARIEKKSLGVWSITLRKHGLGHFWNERMVSFDRTKYWWINWRTDIAADVEHQHNILGWVA
jgi:hypothetical protein